MTTLRECLYRTIHNNEKPLKAIAEEIDMSENYLTRSALPDADDSDTGTGCRFPLKKLIPLINATKDFCTLDFIENSLGRVAVELPKKKNGISDICRLTMRSVRDFGQMIAGVDAGMADGKISALEKEKIIEEGYAAVSAIMTLIKNIEWKGK